MVTQRINVLEKIDPSWPQWQAAAKVAEILRKHGHEAYIVGGAVRDILLGRVPKDFDIVTNAEPTQIQDLEEFKRVKYNDPAQAFGVSRVIIETDSGEELIEIATYRRDIEAHLGRKQTKVEFTTLKEDVRRRDFTVNALALDPTTAEVLDYVDGLSDLEAQLIKFIGKPKVRINEDPLRIMRGIRLRNQLGFEYQKTTEKALKKARKKGQLEKIANERVQDELNKLLTGPNRMQAIGDLDYFGVLKVYIPELLEMKGVQQPPQFHSEGDVWQHTLLAMSYLPENVSIRLAWATLLHDVGKPVTFTPQKEAGDRIRFSGHHKQGAEIAKDILKRLNYPRKTIQEVAWMVYYHMAIADLPKMRPGHRRKFLDHPAFLDLLELHKADAHAAWSQDKQGTLDTTDAEFPEIEKLYQEHHRQQQEPTPSLKKDLGIEGNWLSKNLDLSEGPLLGAVLEELEHLYLEGKIKSKLDAKREAQKILKAKR